MPELPSLTGYDRQTAFDIKLDTARTLDNILNVPDQKTPVDLNQKSYYGDSDPLTSNIAGNQPKPSSIDLGEALVSSDPKLRLLAQNTMKQATDQDRYTSLGLGEKISTPYEQGAKYIDNKFGFDALTDNEDFYYRNQYMQDHWAMRTVKNVLNFNSRVVVGAVTKFAEGLGYLGSMAWNFHEEGFKSALGKDTTFWADVADNGLSKIMKEADEGFRNYVLPVYKEAGFDEQGFFSKLTEATYWNDSVADGVAFLASAFIPAGIASKAGWLAKGASLFGRATPLARGANIITKALTGADTFGEAGLVAFNVANEAAFEAADSFKQNKATLLAARARGENNLTDAQIDADSGSKASSVFGWNAATLMFSNAWEMKNVIKPLLGRSGKAVANSGRIGIGDAGEASIKKTSSAMWNAVKDNSIYRRGKFYGGRFLSGTLAEGFWEENIQGAIQRSAAGSYERRGYNDTETELVGSGFMGIMEQYAKQTIDVLTGDDKENEESVGMGGLIALLGGTAGAKLGRRTNPITGKTSFFIGERKANDLDTTLKISQINNARNNRMSLEDIRNPDGSMDHNKLRVKIAEFKDFSERQDILDAIKEEGTMPKHEVEVLENKLLNDYAKGLAKVGKIRDAIKRYEAMVGREPKEGEVVMGNPAMIASYLSDVADIYDKVQNTKVQNTIPKDYTLQQMQIINEARKDRAYDLLAERRALKPVFDLQETQIQETFKQVTDFLATNVLGGGQEIQEGLGRNKATEYLEAIAKQEFYTGILKNQAPQFVKDHYEQKLQEAKDAIAGLDTFLGDDKPTIKDGKLEFKGNMPEGYDKFLDSVLTVYKDEFLTGAEVEFLQQQNEFIANKILDGETGLDSFKALADFFEDSMQRKILEARTKPADPVVTPPVDTVTTPADTTVVADANTTGPVAAGTVDLNKIDTPPVDENKPEDTVAPAKTDLPPMDTTEGATLIIQEGPKPDVVPEKIEGDEKIEEIEITETEEVLTVNPDELPKTDSPVLDINKPITYATPLMTSKNDTIAAGDSAERTRDIPYDEMRQAFIAEILSNPDLAKKYKMFIVKDVFDDVNRPPANNENAADYVGAGQVIVIETMDGKRPTVREIFGKARFKGLQNLPIVFSFNKKMFSDRLDQRKNLWTAKEGLSKDDAQASYEEQIKRGEIARNLVKTPEDKVEIKLMATSAGVAPQSSWAAVTERFQEEFEVSVATTGKKKGAIQVKIAGSAPFTVGTQKIIESSADFMNIQKTLEKTYKTREEAKQVRSQYLNSLVYTNTNFFFTVDKEGDGFKINYRIVPVDKRHISKKYDKMPYAIKSPGAVHELRFNFDKKSAEKGLNIYNPDTGTFEFFSDREDYMKFIKPKLTTNLKRILDSKGNLKMRTVNAHFSFTIVDPRVAVEDVSITQQRNYDAYVARIKLYIERGTLDIPKVRQQIKQALANGRFSKEQFDKLTQALDRREKAAQPLVDEALPGEVLPTVTEDPRAEQIAKFFEGIGSGVDENARAKVTEYVNRIIAGESYAAVTKGLTKAFTEPVVNLLAELGWQAPSTFIPEAEKKFAELTALIAENQARVQGRTEDKNFYIIDGESDYKRVSNVIPNDFDGDSNAYQNSRIAGNTVDGIVREFFADENQFGDGPVKPEGISEEAFKTITDNLLLIRRRLLARGERFLTSNIVLFDKDLKIAGEVDILAIDAQGNVKIYDIKTAKDFGKYDKRFKEGKLTKRENHTNQLSAYSNLLYNQYGIEVKALAILPFEIAYDSKGNISRATKMDGISLKYNPEIEKVVPRGKPKLVPEEVVITAAQPKGSEINYDDLQEEEDPFEFDFEASSRRFWAGQKVTDFNEAEDMERAFGSEKKAWEMYYKRKTNEELQGNQSGNLFVKPTKEELKEEAKVVDTMMGTTVEERAKEFFVNGEPDFNGEEKAIARVDSRDAALEAYINRKTKERDATAKSKPAAPKQTAKEKMEKAKAKNQTKEKVNIKDIIASDHPTEYKILSPLGEDFVFDVESGILTHHAKHPKLKNVRKPFAVLRTDSAWFEYLNEAAKQFPYTKYPDGTVSGFMRMELQSEGAAFGANIIAYGLPTAKDNELFFTENGKAVAPVGQDEIELPIIPYLNKVLTENGQAQLKEFLNRNC